MITTKFNIMKRFSLILRVSVIAAMMAICCACTDKDEDNDKGKYPWSPNDKEEIRDDSQNPDDKE